MRLTIFIFLFAVIGVCSGQAFEKTFSGQWAMTSWTFEFHKDGTYKRTSAGHYGDPIYIGNYYVQGDTLEILTGFNHSNGTISHYYLLDGDSLIVDLENFYDYQLNAGEWLHLSKKRYDVLPKPNMDSVITISKKVFLSTVSRCITTLTNYEMNDISDYYHLMIIRCYNTISFDRDIREQTPCKELMELIKKKDYVVEISKLYDWIPDRGMGYYFQKLQIELGGTPHRYSLYTIME